MAYEQVFSKFEARAMGIKTVGDEAYTHADCVGSVEEEMDVKVVTKMCRGVEVKKRPRGAGTGTLTLSLHMPYALYVKMYDMEREELVKGVQAYGQKNYHKEFAVTLDVYDEDGKEMLLAYPRCICATGPNTSITNGEEEVAEIEVEVSVMPDDAGYCRYECVVDDLEEENKTIATQWMESFTPDLVAASV